MVKGTGTGKPSSHGKGTARSPASGRTWGSKGTDRRPRPTAQITQKPKPPPPADKPK